MNAIIDELFTNYIVCCYPKATLEEMTTEYVFSLRFAFYAGISAMVVSGPTTSPLNERYAELVLASMTKFKETIKDDKLNKIAAAVCLAKAVEEKKKKIQEN